ncbi:MAG TPA: aminotransferase class V-fold PLP-dependent enzyme [Steroidobacteraceae bacterium]|nr:aminotransferase class V-fold PLP-dependent enzyme [Steroidobacteraceae bacterium]
MSAPAYLDCAATTPVDPRVAAEMAACLTADGVFGNPSSGGHVYGARAREAVEAARVRAAAAVGACAEDLLFTSGATEADNLAVFGVARHARARGRHIVTARTEHKAVLDPCRELERRGWQVTYLQPGRDGIVEAAQVEAALRADTVLVSIMHVNNEIGVIQDIGAIAEVCARHGGARLHVDAAQSTGKCGVDFAACGADLMSLSAHKTYGPKGVGALLLARRRGLQIEPLQFGGGQERGLRSGTVATHQVVGMAAALSIAAAEQSADSRRARELQQRLWEGLAAQGGVVRNGSEACGVAQILNVSFQDVEGESLLASVAAEIAVSTGSACASATDEASYVLRALGRDARLAESSLRFGLGRFTTALDIERAIAAVAAALARLRRIGGVCDTAS